MYLSHTQDKNRRSVWRNTWQNRTNNTEKKKEEEEEDKKKTRSIYPVLTLFNFTSYVGWSLRKRCRRDRLTLSVGPFAAAAAAARVANVFNV